MFGALLRMSAFAGIFYQIPTAIIICGSESERSMQIVQNRRTLLGRPELATPLDDLNRELQI
ncbi:MAG: hypothetical protein E5Y81_07440 [Mesorhizobium sp.]|nr:MAG: hypothetical protein E5Y81_07440 [Mesorhizobium sp.]